MKKSKLITQELKKLVVAEAQALRKHATQEEKDKLCLELLRPTHRSSCVYGLMTGHCHSYRAFELINKCSQPFSEDLFYNREDIMDCEFKFSKSKKIEFQRSADRDFSPIEYYITLPGAKISDLIGLIKS